MQGVSPVHSDAKLGDGPIGKRRPALFRYAVAVAVVILGGAARGALSLGVGPTALPFIFFFPAVAIAAWFGGVGPGILSVALSALAATWFFAAPTITSTP